jgi:hypothetical protein
MMSSVIPARLEFQCGHAALVSLPRVKGESSAQRTARIAREKTAARVRSCDFCPPPLELVPHELAAAAASVAVVETQTIPPVAPVAPVAPPIAPVAPPIDPVALPTAPVAMPVAPVSLPTGPVAVPVAPVATPTDGPTRTTRKRVARPHRSAAPVVHSTPNGHAASHLFVVRFRTEAVLHATDIRDALRQVESLGATEVLALNRTV